MAYLGEEMKKHSILIGILTGLLISSGVLAQSEVVWATEFAWTNQQQAILATDSLQRIYLATQIFNPEAISLFGATLPIDQGDIPPDETTSATIDASGGVLELPSGVLAQVSTSFLSISASVTLSTFPISPITYPEGFTYPNGVPTPIAPHTVVELPYSALDQASDSFIAIFMPAFPGAFDAAADNRVEIRVTLSDGQEFFLFDNYAYTPDTATGIKADLLRALLTSSPPLNIVLSLQPVRIDPAGSSLVAPQGTTGSDYGLFTIQPEYQFRYGL